MDQNVKQDASEHTRRPALVGAITGGGAMQVAEEALAQKKGDSKMAEHLSPTMACEIIATVLNCHTNFVRVGHLVQTTKNAAQAVLANGQRWRIVADSDGFEKGHEVTVLDPNGKAVRVPWEDVHAHNMNETAGHIAEKREVPDVRKDIVEVGFAQDGLPIYTGKLDLATGNVFGIEPAHRTHDDADSETSIVLCGKTVEVTPRGNGSYSVRQEQLTELKDAVFEDLRVGLKVQLADGSIQDGFTVWEGGADVARCNDVEGAMRVASALRLSGSVEHLWVTKGAKFENVYDDPAESLTESDSQSPHM
jgi:hypothetical protein